MTRVIRRRVRVLGQVQGVGFRYTCRQQAQNLGVVGSVSNRDDGSVEAVFEGAPDAVHAMIAWCRRGPTSAWVSDLEVTDEEPTGERVFRVI